MSLANVTTVWTIPSVSNVNGAKMGSMEMLLKKSIVEIAIVAFVGQLLSRVIISQVIADVKIM